MKNLYQEARRCFLLSDPDEKLDVGMEVVRAFQTGGLEWKEGETPEQLIMPGRLDLPLLVSPNELPRRGFGSVTQRAALIHALAHIELTAVNLAWDCIYRYRGMPYEYYQEWVEAAADETKHFRALRSRLRAMGFDYGDFAAHDRLWESAVQTAGDLADRMGIVHRVYEARALDVVPKILDKFQAAGDSKTAAVLTVVANDEVRHVGAGTYWFRYRCEQMGVEPDALFFNLLKKYMGRYPKGPFNRTARSSAGFSDNELALLELHDGARCFLC